MPPDRDTDGTYAPRSPDLSSFSLPPPNSRDTPNTSSYHIPNSSTQPQSQNRPPTSGYTPKSPDISPYNESERAHINIDRRTSYVPPTLANFASKSPEVANFQRRHSAYIPPSDLPSINTNYSGSRSSYTSPVYTRNPGGFTNSPSTQSGYRSGYSIPQSALTYQPPINQPSQPENPPPLGEFKSPYMRNLNLEDRDTIPEQKMEGGNNVKIESINGGMGQAPMSMSASKGIEVKTKFPVARIKRIMQADEEVGKVAQVTPVVVSKALELFMISLVTKSADLARIGNSKRVTAVHLKKTIEGDEQFDFLNEIVAKVAEGPDAGQEKTKRGKSVDDGSDSEEKPKKKGRKKRGD